MQPTQSEEKEKRKNEGHEPMTRSEDITIKLFATITLPIIFVAGVYITSLVSDAKINIPHFLLYNFSCIPLVLIGSVVIGCIGAWIGLFIKWRQIGCLFVVQLVGFLGVCGILYLWMLLQSRTVYDEIQVGESSYVISETSDVVELFVCSYGSCNGTAAYLSGSVGSKGYLSVINNEYLQLILPSSDTGNIFCYPLSAINQDISYANYKRTDLDRTCPPSP